MKKIFNVKQVVVFMLLFFIIANIVNPAFATGDASGATLEDYICNVFKYLTGTVGKALAAFACVGVSLAFVGGKIQWTTVLVFAIAMACIFGAPQIVKAFSGGDLACADSDVTFYDKN